jgi:excisionase family DNA binding protein
MTYDPHNTTAAVPPEALDAEQVGALLGCSGRHVQRLAARGLFPAPIALGALRRWPRSAVLAWLAERSAAGVATDGPTATRGGRRVMVRG